MDKTGPESCDQEETSIGERGSFQKSLLELSSTPSNDVSDANQATTKCKSVAWLHVLASFLLFFNVLGLLNSYGQFQALYEREILSTHSSGTIAWIGSSQYLITYLTTIGSGIVRDAGYTKPLLHLGHFLSLAGILCVSFCQKYYQFFLAQAVLTGLGFGSSTPVGFGIAIAGSSIGAVTYPILIQRLSQTVGFRWAVRALCLIMLLTLLLATLLLRRPGHTDREKQQPRQSIKTQLKDRPYMIYCISLFVGCNGLYVFYYYINLYAVSRTSAPPSRAFYLLAILNAGSLFGRLLLNLVTHRVGPINMSLLFSLLSGVTAFSLMAVRTTASVIVFAIAFGFVSAPVVTMPVLGILSLTADRRAFGVRSGIGFACMGLGVFVGGSAARFILDGGDARKEVLNWNGLIAWCGGILFASASLLVWVRIAKFGCKIVIKA